MNWTDGCVALDDRDMDKVYGYVREGTPVFIIGASEDWRKTGAALSPEIESWNK